MGPEESMQIQSNLASTIAMAFDECPPSTAARKYMEDSVARTTRWLHRCKAEMDRLNMVFRKGRIEEEEYDAEYYKLEKRLKSLDVTEPPPQRDLDAIKGILETDYLGIYAKLTKENKKAFWRSFIREFAIDEDKKIIPDSIIFF